MITTALTLAILTTAGFLIIYLKLPQSVRNFIQNHTLMTDCVALIAIYVLLGGTLTALIAASMCGLFVSILLYCAGNKKRINSKVKDMQKNLKF